MSARSSNHRNLLGMKPDRFSGSAIWTIAGLALVSAAIGSVLVLIEATLHPPASDLTALATFLALSGASTVAVGLAFRKFRFPAWLRSLRTRLILVSVLTTTLALINVGFTSFLMFISGHDLALLASPCRSKADLLYVAYCCHQGWQHTSRTQPHFPKR